MQTRHLRVGVTENPPWVARAGSEPAGVEVELVRRFAAELGATPDWIWGSEQEHLEALKRFELDLAIAGMDAQTPWRKTIGFTRPYFQDTLMVGSPPGADAPANLKGAKVLVRDGDVAAAYIRKQGGVAVGVPQLGQPSALAGAPDWQLQRWGFRPLFELHKNKHVMAAPPGENGWLNKLQDFLRQQQPNVRELLVSQAEAGQ
jgi:polar amino acid transport system substrate-binding protein